MRKKWYGCIKDYLSPPCKMIIITKGEYCALVIVKRFTKEIKYDNLRM